MTAPLAHSTEWLWRLVEFYYLLSQCVQHSVAVTVYPAVMLLTYSRCQWFRSRVVSVLDSCAVAPGFKSQP